MSEPIRVSVEAVKVSGFYFECPECKEKRLAIDQGALKLLEDSRTVHTKCPCGQPVAMRMLIYKPSETIMNRKMRRRTAPKKVVIK